jgi:pimeloyl-ACP methyl ester carboxylesterase
MGQAQALEDKSTNVRSKSRERAPAPLRVALRALGGLSPALAARAAEQLFLRPGRHAGRNGRDRSLGGDRFRVPVGRESVLARRFGEGPAVLLVHGWGGSASQLAPFVEPLVAAGCSAVLLDAPAHGGSTGRLTTGIGFAEAITAVAERVEARAAIAHSLGAFGVGWALSEGLALDAAVLVAPPRGPTEFLDRFFDALRLREDVRDATRARLRARLGLAVADVDLPRRAVGDTSVLVIHDRDDREVPWCGGHAIAEAWPGAALVTTRGLGHRRILRDPAVTARATSFVLERLARCACGRPVAGPAGATTCSQCAFERELWRRPSRWVDAEPAPRAGASA